MPDRDPATGRFVSGGSSGGGGNGTVWVDVRGDTSQFMKDVAAGAKKATSGLAGIAKTGVQTVMSDIARSSAVAGVALGGIGAAAVKTSMDFNAAMSGVAAVANSSAAEMETLRKAALKAGADTVFSASQAADAQAELVKAGVSVSDVLGGALTGSLSLAAAGQLNLADAATISAQAMNLFNLGGDQVGHIADVLAAGANKSAADVDQLGQALQQGGLLAKQTGLSLEETVGVLSLFADNALIGSDAGTSLKTMLQRLVPATGPVADAMNAIGLSFYDAQGQFVGIEQAAQRMQVAFKDLSEEQRSEYMTQIFGSDAVRAANILYEAGATGVRDYTTAVNDMGAAQRMAAKQTDNLKGDIEAFKGSTETALINLGDLADSSLRSVTQSATGFVNVFNDFANTPAWTAIARNVDELTSGLGGGLDGLSEDLRGLLDGIDPAEVDRVFATVSGTFSRLREAVQGMEGVIAGVGLSIAGLGAQSVLGPLGGIIPAISPITGILGGLVLGSDEGRDALKGLGKQAQQFATGTGADLLESLSSLSQEVAEGLASALEEVGTALFDAADVLGPVFGDALEELGPPIGDLIEQLGHLVAEVLPTVADLAGSILPPAFDVLGTGVGVAADAVGLLADNADLLIPALAGIAAIRFSDNIAGWANGIASAGSTIAGRVGDFRTFFGVLRAEGQNIGGALSGAASATGSLSGALTGMLNPAVLGVTAAVSVGTGIYQAWSTAKADAERTTRALADALLAEEDTLDSTATALRRSLNNLRDESYTNEFNKVGLSIRGVSEEMRAFPGQMDEFREVFNTVDEGFDDSSWGELEARMKSIGATIPESVQQIREAVQNDVIDADAGRELINIMTNLDQSTAVAADNLVANFRDLQDAANDAGIDLSDFKTRFDAATTFEDRKAIIAEITRQFPELAGAIDVVAGAAGAADNELRRLIDTLAELADAPRDVDEATRRLSEALDRVAKSFADNGAGIDASTEAGRKNADAIKAQIEAAERLAEAQALLDPTGQQSTLTLLAQRKALEDLAAQGLLTADQLAHLIEIYGLTDQDIQTTVSVDTAEAQRKLAEVQADFDSKKAEMSEPIRSDIQTKINEGDYQTAIARLKEFDRERQVWLRIGIKDGSWQSVIGGLTGVKLDGKRAAGGPVWPGTWLVGEDGPELLNIPTGMRGTITPSDEARQVLARSAGPPAPTPNGTDGATLAPLHYPQPASPAGIEARLDRTVTAVETLGAKFDVMSGELRVLSGSMSHLATRPLPRPVVDVRASDGVHVTAETRARSARSGD